MIKPFFFNDPLLPVEFQFPQKYKELAENNSWPDIEPWYFLAGSKALSLSYFGEMLLKFPNATLVPFAYINDQSGLCNDGYVVLACFDAGSEIGEPCVRIYDFGSPQNTPWDNLSYKDYDEWIIAAQKESTQFKIDKAEIEEDD